MTLFFGICFILYFLKLSAGHGFLYSGSETINMYVFLRGLLDLFAVIFD